MAATATAVIGRYEAPVVSGVSVPYAFGIQGSQLDLLQIASPGDTTGGAPPTVLLNVDYLGNVHNPPVNPTNGTEVGVFWTTLANGATTAALFASAFENLSLLDILQIINQGGNISYWLDYLGVAHGA